MNEPRLLSKTFGQLARYGLSGVIINALLYGLYLGLTMIYFAPWQASTICFSIGIPISYATHRRYTFQNADSSIWRKIGFSGAYISGYLLQIGGLYLLFNVGGIPHQIAQVMMMAIVALWLFFVQKLLIFKLTIPKTR